MNKVWGKSERPSTGYPDISKSNDWYFRAEGLIPAYTQTLAKGPGQHVKGVAPKYLQRGKGSHVWDVDGNEFIDFNMGIGPISLGYCYDAVDEAIRNQLNEGITFSLMHPLEVEVAELIREIIPNAEMVRFSKTGCDVTSAAIRIARAYTGKNKILCCGYHGWHDWYISVTDRNLGIPETIQNLTATFDYNDLASVRNSIDDDTACIILEPVVFQEPRPDFLQGLRDICDRHGIILIFDEMWTGFRIALGGAQQRYGVKADLTCFSKAVANGMPLSILTGQKEIMQLCDREVFFFTTFGGETLSLAAARATIRELKNKNVPEYLALKGKKIRQDLQKIIDSISVNFISCNGVDCRTMLSFDQRVGNPLEMKSLVQQELIARGILWSGFHNLCYSHSDADIEQLLNAYFESLVILKQAVEEGNVRKYLYGEPVEPVFRRTVNFNTKPVNK